MTSDRFIALDALRGLAALSVFLFHALSHNEILWQSGFGNVLGRSPFAFAISGGSAVMLFFVISGFVLSGVSRSATFSRATSNWVAARLVRLYLPIYPALLLAVVVNSLVTQRVSDEDLPLSLALDATLIFGHGNLLEVLWSLRWEVVFSLCLPFATRLGFPKIDPRMGIVLCLATSVAGNLINFGLLQYTPVMFAGYFLERLLYERNKSQASDRRLLEGRQVQFGVPLALVMLGAEMNLTLWTRTAWHQEVQVIGQLIGIIGSILLVALFARRDLEKLAARPSLSFLGRISFSLYLVHKPVLEAVTIQEPVAHILLSTLLAILVAQVFYVCFEKPSLSLSKKIKKVIT